MPDFRTAKQQHYVVLVDLSPISDTTFYVLSFFPLPSFYFSPCCILCNVCYDEDQLLVVSANPDDCDTKRNTRIFHTL